MLTHILAIDPVPPPSDLQVAKGFADKDYEALSVVGTYAGKFYLREVRVNRGHDPSWTCVNCMELAIKYRTIKWVLEAIAYQRTLKWIIEQFFRRERRYYRIDAIADTRSKYTRIVDALNGPASNGVLYIPPDTAPEGASNSEGMAMFVEQFGEYPGTTNDDALDSVSAGISSLTGQASAEDESLPPEDEDAEMKPPERNLAAMCP
jgi:phage terminase large subunit-like protein